MLGLAEFLRINGNRLDFGDIVGDCNERLMHTEQGVVAEGCVDAACGGRNMVKFIKAKVEVRDELY